MKRLSLYWEMRSKHPTNSEALPSQFKALDPTYSLNPSFRHQKIPSKPLFGHRADSKACKINVLVGSDFSSSAGGD